MAGMNGDYPPGPPVFDAAGNLYGITGNGGTTGSGVAFELIGLARSSGSDTPE
jgi:hypothetical protein